MSQRWRRALLVLLTLVVTCALAVVVVLHSDWLRDRLRRLAISQADKYLTGQLTIGHLSGSLFHDVVLDDVTLTQTDGVVMHATRVSVKYDWRMLVQRHLVLDDLLVEQPSLRVAAGPEGWNVGHLLRKRDSTGAPLALLIDRLRLVNGDVDIVPASGEARHLRAVNADARLVRTSDRFIAQLTNVSLHDDASGYDVRQLAGRLEDGLRLVDVTFAADRQAARINGRVKSTTDERGRHADVALDLATVDLQAFFNDPKWQSDLSLHADAHADAPASLDAATFTFKVAGAHARALGYEGTDLVATGQWASSQLKFDAAAAGYGGAATIRATWQLSSNRRQPPGFDGAGTFRNVSLPRLPPGLKLPPLESRLAGKYQVHQDAGGWRANVVLDASTVEGASIAAGTTGSLDQRPGVTTYTADGDLDGLDLNRLARPLDLPFLADARYRSRLAGHFSVDGREGCADRGCSSKRSVHATTTMAEAQLADTKLFDVTSTMTFTDPRLDVAARGRVERLTTETMGVGGGTALDLNGTVDGTLVLNDVHAPFSLTGMSAGGVASLTTSTIAGLTIDQADIDASLADGTLTLRKGVATGIGVKADACGTMAFGETGTSALDVTMDADDLTAIGTWSGQPIAGAGHIEAHVTGPHDQPALAGRYSLRQIAYGGDVSALTLNGDLHASMPEWRVADATFSSKGEGAFIKIKSVEITRFSGQASFAHNQIDLDADLADAARELKVAGQLALSSPNRALSVRTLSLTTAGETWTLPAGTTAVLRADATKIEVNDLTLAKGAQRVSADGAFALTPEGTSSSAGLRLRFDQVQLADANRIVLGTRRLEGLLNGDVTVAGPVDDLRVNGEISMTNGMVEKTPFESLRAQVALANHDLTLDATLVQSAANQVKAAGHVPVGAGSLSSPRPMDVSITSTQIDLGLAQLFTSSVTNIGGSGELNLKLTGSPQSPVIDGAVNVANGTFMIAGGGVTYSKITAGLVFKANHLAVQTLEVHDNDDHLLRVSGEFDVLGEAENNAFNVQLHAEAFHVLKNELGTLLVKADVYLTGDLAAPVVKGQLRLDSGRLEVAQILERTTKSAYSTTPGEPLTTEPVTDTPLVPAKPEQPATPPPPVKPPEKSLFDRVDLDLSVRLPDNLVMRGRGLRAAGSTLGLGDMNVIAGGDLRIRKPPSGPLDVLGNIELVRGTYTFQGRRFDVQRGSEVRFRGAEPTNPALDVAAERDVNGVAATVHVTGTARRPQLTLTSQPPLDQAEILSLIAFGQPLGDLGQNQRLSLAEQAGLMAAGTITTPLGDSIARALDLDLFEILPPSDTEQRPVVSVGSQIGSRVYVGAKQEVGGDSSAVTFEYRFARFLRLVTTFAQGALQAHSLERSETAGIDLLFVFRY
jgi:autotransporter translocation and assembly factor TamB